MRDDMNEKIINQILFILSKKEDKQEKAEIEALILDLSWDELDTDTIKKLRVSFANYFNDLLLDGVNPYDLYGGLYTLISNRLDIFSTQLIEDQNSFQKNLKINGFGCYEAKVIDFDVLKVFKNNREVIDILKRMIQIMNKHTYPNIIAQNTSLKNSLDILMFRLISLIG